MTAFNVGFSDHPNDRKAALDAGQYFYGSEYRDEYLLCDPKSLLRYGHLARKVLMHYAGDHYNPHTICITQEPFIRLLIKGFIEYKVVYKTGGYDWEMIDNFFKKVVSDYYKLNLPYDEKVLKRQFKPEFRAQFLNHENRPV